MPFSVGLSAEVIKYDKQVKEVKDVPKLVLTELLNLGDHSAMTSRHHNLLMWDHQLVRCSMREVFSLTPCFVSVQGKDRSRKCGGVILGRNHFRTMASFA